MNPKPISETETLRSDIEMTRRRMDDTIDALGERVRGRHLVDEVIGYFRHNPDTAAKTGERVREKLSQTAGTISESAGNAATAVADTVKKNPLPFLMIAAGAAWLTYSMTRGRKAEVEEEPDDFDRYDPDTHYDRPLEYPDGATSAVGEPVAGSTDEENSKLGQLKEKAMAAKDQVKDRLSDLSDTARDTFESAKHRASEFGSRVRDRASELGSQVQDRTREAYDQARERVVRTADEHPLELGLGCLAAGVLIGLAIPTPDPVNRIAGPTVDKLRNRTREASRDMLEKGKRVVRAATDAAKQEAQSQGLSLDRLRQSGEAIASSASSAASETAREEGMTGTGFENPRAGAEPADPSAARPAM
jgi:ElaB/YqjD/DUF883 family membrane-anchored ribosome-binding protein